MRPVQNKTLKAIARRYVWWLSPAEVLERRLPVLFRQVLSLATAEDHSVIEAAFGRAALIRAIETAPPGSIDDRSWNFWRLLYGLGRRAPPRRKMG